MTDLYIEGPDVIALLSDLGVNTFANFQVDKAKQFVACNHDGYVIGDAILFFLDENRGQPRRPPVGAQLGSVPRRDRRLRRERGARRAHGGQPDRAAEALPLPGPGSDRARRAGEGERRRAARDQVLQPRRAHDRRAQGAGAPPRHVGRARPRALRAVGRSWRTCAARSSRPAADYGLRQVGSRVYATNTLESGWIPCPLPAIFTGDELKAYREWLPADGYEGTGSLGGSYYADDISDYYPTPHDLGYWPFVKFDHDFVGREALEAMGDEPERKKVTLAWNGEDVATAMGSLFEKGEAAKYINLPLSNYATWPHDKLLHDGEIVGVSTFSGLQLQRALDALARLRRRRRADRSRARHWCGARRAADRPKPVVERHRQAEIRVVVSPCPYSEVVRTLVPRGVAFEGRRR